MKSRNVHGRSGSWYYVEHEPRVMAIDNAAYKKDEISICDDWKFKYGSLSNGRNINDIGLSIFNNDGSVSVPVSDTGSHGTSSETYNGTSSNGTHTSDVPKSGGDSILTSSNIFENEPRDCAESEVSEDFGTEITSASQFGRDMISQLNAKLSQVQEAKRSDVNVNVSPYLGISDNESQVFEGQDSDSPPFTYAYLGPEEIECTKF